MARPPKYPFAHYARTGELYVLQLTDEQGGLAGLSRIQNAAYTYAKRHGLACKTAKTVVYGYPDKTRDARYRSAIQFAPRMEADTFQWASCFDTKARATETADRDAAEHAGGIRWFRVCEHCLMERPLTEFHDCDYCGGCERQIGIDMGPPASVRCIHDRPETNDADLPEPPAVPLREARDSESDVTC